MLNLNLIHKILVLGEGITANAVNKKLSELKLFEKINTLADKPDLIIISPGINPEKYSNLPIPVISEIQLAILLFNFFKKTPYLFATSGTNGKTTTTDLISQLLDIPSGGNIGKPLIDYVQNDPSKVPNQISLELSSYQLETSPFFSPDVYILLNITEDHLDRHKTMQNYTKIKLSPVTRMKKNSLFIFDDSNQDILNFLVTDPPKCSTIGISDLLKEHEQLLRLSPLQGEHNKINLAAALGAVLIKEKIPTLNQKIPKIKAYPHRLEKILEIKKISFVNDSKSTNPDSGIAAINSFKPEKTILLLGGRMKLVSYENLITLIAKKKIRVILFGEAAPKLKEIMAQIQPQILFCGKSMKEAVLFAFKKAQPEDIILLSPACASFDEFKNFEERGHEFKKIVTKLSSK